MPKPPRPWTVIENEPIEQIDDNLWGVAGKVPDFPKGAGMDRPMSLVRLADGRLVFHNAVPVDDVALAKLRAWGEPAILLVPMHLHAIDAHAFRAKLGVKVYTSKATVDKTREIVEVDGTFEDLPADPALACRPLSGTKFGEAAWAVTTGPRASLLFCDAIQNNRPGTGFNGFMFKIMGFTGEGLKTPPFYKLRAVSDKAALKRDVLALADTPGLARIVPSHGLIVSTDPA